MVILNKTSVRSEVRQMMTEIYSDEYSTYVIIDPEVLALGICALKTLYDALFDLNDKLLHKPNWPISALVHTQNGFIQLDHDYFQRTWKPVFNPQTQTTSKHVVTVTLFAE